MAGEIGNRGRDQTPTNIFGNPKLREEEAPNNWEYLSKF